MQFNNFIFPAPKISYSGESKNIIWISGDEPKYNNEQTFIRNFQKFKVKAKILNNHQNFNKNSGQGIYQNSENNKKFVENQVYNQNFSFQNKNKQFNEADKENYNTCEKNGKNQDNQNFESKSQILEEKTQKKKIFAKKSPIPCLYLPFQEGSDSILIYFHGNAEDLGYSYDFANALRKNLQINVLSVEYPGYGAYEGNPCSDKIIEDCEIVFEFLTSTLNISAKKIFLFGRSIGSGPATHLASKKRPGCLILMCPYTSIRNIVKDLVGAWPALLVADRFKNIEKISKVRCPSFFVHGQKDKLIPYQHSIDLMSKCQGMSYLNLSENMTHNEFRMMDDIIVPLKKFFQNCEIRIQTGNGPNRININTMLFRKPKENSILIEQMNTQQNE
ncbi:hypothetical protein PPERSA_09220 [Pseudocohnilembus persalinus]|uniref:Serine aminopeptidase S33 domain-containing protein n=1 Tax=Pseudocohnilembus persalinus TaxID=266149 RepID=A0A0V0R534_PSEPJ|nr:hypothetical protein PPERSA_09220 [Pseudocohnilembus persalinus]|eukprot:KRX09336.1 hypothetical protein PPERSA_09220 [Pseudocohnilembus persalinus]